MHSHFQLEQFHLPPKLFQSEWQHWRSKKETFSLSSPPCDRPSSSSTTTLFTVATAVEGFICRLCFCPFKGIIAPLPTRFRCPHPTFSRDPYSLPTDNSHSYHTHVLIYCSTSTLERTRWCRLSFDHEGKHRFLALEARGKSNFDDAFY